MRRSMSQRVEDYTVMMNNVAASHQHQRDTSTDCLSPRTGPYCSLSNDLLQPKTRRFTALRSVCRHFERGVVNGGQSHIRLPPHITPNLKYHSLDKTNNNSVFQFAKKNNDKSQVLPSLFIISCSYVCDHIVAVQ